MCLRDFEEAAGGTRGRLTDTAKNG